MNAESIAVLLVMICETKHEIEGVVTIPLGSQCYKKHLGSLRVKALFFSLQFQQGRWEGGQGGCYPAAYGRGPETSKTLFKLRKSVSFGLMQSIACMTNA